MCTDPLWATVVVVIVDIGVSLARCAINSALLMYFMFFMIVEQFHWLNLTLKKKS